MQLTTRRNGMVMLLLVVLSGLSLALMVGTSSAQGEGGLVPVFEGPVQGDFALAGNTNMACPPVGDEHYDATCHDAAISNSQLAVTNDAFYMRYANGDEASINQSTAQLQVPPGADIVFARLFWGGNTGNATLEGTPFPACNATYVNDGEPAAVIAPGLTRERVRIDIDGAGPVDVVGALSGQTEAGPGGEVYAASADITAMLAATPVTGPLTVSVADVATPEGNNCHGGWAVLAVYEHPDAPIRHVSIHEGFVRQAATDPTTVVTADGFVATEDGAPRIGVVAYEGDRGISGDRFFVNGVAIGAPQITPALTSNNFFASSVDGAVDPGDSNSWGIDAAATDVNGELVPAGHGAAALGFDTTGDSFYGQVVAFSVATEPEPTVDPAAPTTTTPPVDSDPEFTGDPDPIADPTEPVDPIDPAEPVDPADPIDPGEPVDPAEPADPADPVDAADPIDPAEPFDPADPIDPADPGDAADPGEPAEPVDSADPIDPGEPVDPADPIDPADPGDAADPLQPAEPVEPADPVDPVDPVDPAEPVDQADPVDQIDPTEPADQVDPEDPEAPAESIVPEPTLPTPAPSPPPADEPAAPIDVEVPPSTDAPTTTTEPAREPAPSTSAEPVVAGPDTSTSIPTEVLSEVLTNQPVDGDVAAGEQLAFTGRTSLGLVLLALTFLSSGAAILVGGGMVRRRSWS